MKESKDKSSFVLIVLIQSDIQFLDTVNSNKNTLTLKASSSKLSLKNQATALSSELLVNLIEIADEMEIMKNSFKQTIDESDVINAAHFSALTFKYKLSACSQFFRVLILLNDYSKSARETVKKEKMSKKNTESEIENKKNKY